MYIYIYIYLYTCICKYLKLITSSLLTSRPVNYSLVHVCSSWVLGKRQSFFGFKPVVYSLCLGSSGIVNTSCSYLFAFDIVMCILVIIVDIYGLQISLKSFLYIYIYIYIFSNKVANKFVIIFFSYSILLLCISIYPSSTLFTIQYKRNIYIYINIYMQYI